MLLLFYMSNLLVIINAKSDNFPKTDIRQALNFSNQISRQPCEVGLTAAVTLVYRQHIVAVPHTVLTKEIILKVFGVDFYATTEQF